MEEYTSGLSSKYMHAKFNGDNTTWPSLIVTTIALILLLFASKRYYNKGGDSDGKEGIEL